MEVNAKIIALALLMGGLAGTRSQAQTSTTDTGSQPTVGAAPVPLLDGPGLAGPGLEGPDPQRHRGGQHPGRGKGGPRGEGRPGPDNASERRPGRPDSGLMSLTTVSGTVGQFTASDDFIFDGFTLNTATGKTSAAGSATTVKFPPHLGQQVQQALKSGANVSVTGYSEMNPTGESMFRMTSLTAGKNTVLDTPPVVPTPSAASPALVTETGKVADYRLGRDGRVNGFVLDNQTIVRIPPHAAFQLANLAKKGSTITVQGYQRPLGAGQVQLEKTNILRASVLTINGQQYLVR